MRRWVLYAFCQRIRFYNVWGWPNNKQNLQTVTIQSCYWRYKEQYNEKDQHTSLNPFAQWDSRLCNQLTLQPYNISIGPLALYFEMAKKNDVVFIQSCFFPGMMVKNIKGNIKMSNNSRNVGGGKSSSLMP